ncbi:bifunctional 5,10-methylenetetrahydrofolate dehydrogenase/5,10-methenyltetrahydrofolate cyclohydrolase [Patescibacteria group bacterium]
MAKIIDGKKLADAKLAELKNKIKRSDKTPGLAIVIVGDDPSSKLYVSLKKKAAKEVGIYFKLHTFPSNTTSDKIISTIKELNHDKTIHGIVVQLPLPAGQDTNAIIASLDPAKDVDGFQPDNINKYLAGRVNKMPLLISVIDQLIDSTEQPLKNKRVALATKIGVFSRALMHYFSSQGALVEITPPDNPVIGQSDFVISALGLPQIITANHIKRGAVVIDVGITKIGRKTLGDVDQKSVAPIAGYLTPVPGGVGPMTVAMLLERTYNSSK